VPCTAWKLLGRLRNIRLNNGARRYPNDARQTSLLYDYFL
jgi:hypothetical protein